MKKTYKRNWNVKVQLTSQISILFGKKNCKRWTHLWVGSPFLTIPFTFLHCLLLPFTLFVASFELFTLDGLQCSKSQTQTTRYRTPAMKQHEWTCYHWAKADTRVIEQNSRTCTILVLIRAVTSSHWNEACNMSLLNQQELLTWKMQFRILIE